MFMEKPISIPIGKPMPVHRSEQRKTFFVRCVLQVLFLFCCHIAVAQRITVGNRSNFIVKGNASVVIKNAGFTNNGTFAPGAGTMKFTGSADTTVSFISGSSNTSFRRVDVQSSSNGIAFKSPVSVTDSVVVSSGHLYSNGNLTLKSTSALTATVAELPVDGSGNATATVEGKVTIERYIAAVKSWRLLAAPVSSANAPTISESWQEGVTTASGTPNPNPGYGTHITGGTVANGFDQGVTSNPSIKYYNNAGNYWTGIPASPGTLAPISSYPAYFLFVRGDRGINLMQGSAATPTNTVLRMKGQLKSGTQTVNISAANYTVVGNPYTASIDFHSITKNNVGDKVYIWDPKMSGTYGLGAYVTLSWNNGAGHYDATSSVSQVSQYIESGQAFVVTSADKINPGTLTIKESDKKKVGTGSVFSFIASPEQSTRVDLFSIAADHSASLVDGVLSTYADENSNAVDAEDAIKIPGSGETVSILQSGIRLSLERHRTITTADTMFLHISQMRTGDYSFGINIAGLSYAGLTAILRDQYLPANDLMPLNTDGSTNVFFTVNSNPASYAPDRFRIEFRPADILAVNFKTITAYKENENIAVQWHVENESDLQYYEAEKSLNGTAFTKMETVAKANTAGNYKVIDNAPQNGNNYYRVRSVNTDGSYSYSRVVKVNLSAVNSIDIFPNPSAGNHIHLQFRNAAAGTYSLRVLNATGAVLFKQTVSVSGSSASVSVMPERTLAAGLYHLEIVTPDGNTETKKLIIQ